MVRKIVKPTSAKKAPSPSPQPKPTPPGAGKNQGAVSFQKTAPAPARQSSQPFQKTGGGLPGGSGLPGGYSSPGGYSDMGLMGGGGPAPMVTAPSEEDYLAGDGSYQSQFAALKGALERYIADSDLQRTNYNTDYGTSLRDLGYTEGLEGAPGKWNWDDVATTSGNAYQGQLNDYASRGMLQSQGYADAASNLERALNQQYGQIQTNKNNFMTDLDRQIANYKGENTSAQQAARAEAIARRAAQYGL